ncbi:MAG: hypothetical protein J7647_18915 [Cyanobacteria bacterium SBLK]|nr:hypothetical protein [Cyanobacteria bacterium SBLK]
MRSHLSGWVAIARATLVRSDRVAIAIVGWERWRSLKGQKQSGTVGRS